MQHRNLLTGIRDWPTVNAGASSALSSFVGKPTKVASEFTPGASMGAPGHGFLFITEER